MRPVATTSTEYTPSVSAGLFATGLIGATVWVRWRLPSADPFLLPIAAMLAALGQMAATVGAAEPLSANAGVAPIK